MKEKRVWVWWSSAFTLRHYQISLPFERYSYHPAIQFIQKMLYQCIAMRNILLMIILIRFQSNSFHNTCFHNNNARSFCFTLPNTACLKHINWENCQWILYCVLKREPLKHKNLNYSFIGDNQPPETLNLGVFRDLLDFYANISAFTSFCPHFSRNCFEIGQNIYTLGCQRSLPGGNMVYQLSLWLGAKFFCLHTYF